MSRRLTTSFAWSRCCLFHLPFSSRHFSSIRLKSLRYCIEYIESNLCDAAGSIVLAPSVYMSMDVHICHIEHFEPHKR